MIRWSRIAKPQVIDNSSIVPESSTALRASNFQLIFLIFVSSSISTVFEIDSIVGDIHVTFLDSTIVKVKVRLKKSPLLQPDLLDIPSSHKFLFTSFTRRLSVMRISEVEV